MSPYRTMSPRPNPRWGVTRWRKYGMRQIRRMVRVLECLDAISWQKLILKAVLVAVAVALVLFFRFVFAHCGCGK